MPTLSDSTRRSIRTGIDQALALATLLLLILPLFGDFLRAVGGDTLTGYVASAGVVMAALVVLFTKVRNLLEDRGIIPALLKATASDGAHPVPDPEAGAATLRLVLIVVAVIVAVWVLAQLI